MGECRQCGKCCRYHLLVTKKDIERLQGAIKDGYQFPISKEELTGQHNSMDTHCPFYDIHTTKCTVYGARPLICQGFYCKKCGGVNQEIMDKLQRKLRKEVGSVLAETNMTRLFRPDLYSLKPGIPVVATYIYKDNGENKIRTVSGTFIRFEKGDASDHAAKLAVVALYNSGGRTITVSAELVQKIFNPVKDLIRQAQRDVLAAGKNPKNTI